MTRARAGEVAVLLIVVLAAAVLFGRGLHRSTNYDEGVYLASVDALRHGQELGTEVFASQPPGFYVLLRIESQAAGRSVTRTRVGMLVLALTGVLAAYALGRALAGAQGGIAAAGVLATAPAYAAESVRVAADVPSLTLALGALALAAWAGERKLALAALAGAAFATALSVKLLVLPALVPLALLLRRSRPIGAAALGALVVAGGLAIAYAASLPAIWHDAVSFHLSGSNLGESKARHLINFFDLSTPFTWIVAGGVCAAVLTRRHSRLWVFVAVVIAFLLAQRPLLDHHFVLLAAVGAIAAAASLPLGRPVVAVALALAIAAAWMQQWRQLGRNDAPEPAAVLAAARHLRAQTTPTELVGADVPIVAFRADRRLPGELADTSAVRFKSGSLSDAKVLATLEEARVRTVVVGREFAGRPRLLAGLRRYRVLRIH